MTDHREDPLQARVREVLDANWTGTHTVPSRTLYPHQWSWDAAFISIGLARIAPDRAWRDLRSLFSAQWSDGRVPHIVFDPGVAERDYFPGPTFWAVPTEAEVPEPPEPTSTSGPTRPTDPSGPTRPTDPSGPTRPTDPTGPAATPGPRTPGDVQIRPGSPTTAGSSGIVQPPVHALGAWEIYRHTPDDAGMAHLRWLYPRLVAQQDYLSDARDVGGGGLASIAHPWESGLDNSPAWDAALASVPVVADLLRRHRRRDNQVGLVDHRPTDDDYARYLALAAAYRDGGYRDADLADRHLFLVECPAFNALRGVAELTLARIARVIGADPAGHQARAAVITRALVERLYDPTTGMFHALDVRTRRLSPARCVNGLVPLVLPDLPGRQVTELVATLRSSRFGLTSRSAVPSYDRTAADFDPVRYWRGPVWLNINWLLWRGLRSHGHEELAATLRGTLLNLVRRSGCYEYFHADSGVGIGSPAFSWTAALTLDLLDPDHPEPA
ncbi:MGH1-like glycoside hydrolase domain-containing protein [Micromonospora sp. NPDC003197]